MAVLEKSPSRAAAERRSEMRIQAGLMHFQELSQRVRDAKEDHILITDCFGQRYIGSGLKGKHIEIEGVPGNALGAYLDGSTIRVYGNVQEATGDTMNDGIIFIHGRAGDATGYAMRGGRIYVGKDTGYRAGIHMKAYQDKAPVLVVGGTAGSFLGEYQAGGRIIVLNLEDAPIPVGNFCATGMHGGKIFIRCEEFTMTLPSQVHVREARPSDLDEIQGYIEEFGQEFEKDSSKILDSKFYLLEPNTSNPYKQLYTNN